MADRNLLNCMALANQVSCCPGFGDNDVTQSNFRLPATVFQLQPSIDYINISFFISDISKIRINFNKVF